MEKITIGYKSGKLTVIEKTDQKRHGYSVWKCRCECGNEINLDTRYLQRRTKTDCGCDISKTNVDDFKGKRFGLLTCLEPVGKIDKNGRSSWRCRCDCGNEITVRAYRLENGLKKSCGCLQHPELKDFIGRRFGSLVVIGYEEKRAGMHRWRCRCDCGNETIVGQTLLQTGKTSSCGCRKSEAIKENLKLCDGTSVTALENKKPLKTNKSGYRGVYQDKRSGKWIAQITFKGKIYHLGSFNDIQDAVKARQKGEEMHEEFLEEYYKNQSLTNNKKEKNNE